MVLGTVAAAGTVAIATAAAPAIAVATGAGSVATATGSGAVAVASAGGTATATTLAGTVTGFASNAAASFAVPLASAGPAGWIALGADDRSWDCWKPVLHDNSSDPSRGRLLREVLEDERVKKHNRLITEDGRQQIHVENQWNEKFVIDLVLVDGEPAAHATKI